MNSKLNRGGTGCKRDKYEAREMKIELRIRVTEKLVSRIIDWADILNRGSNEGND